MPLICTMKNHQGIRLWDSQKCQDLVLRWREYNSAIFDLFEHEFQEVPKMILGGKPSRIDVPLESRLSLNGGTELVLRESVPLANAVLIIPDSIYVVPGKYEKNLFIPSNPSVYSRKIQEMQYSRDNGNSSPNPKHL